jgi:Ca-activated chloride channel family protein
MWSLEVPLALLFFFAVPPLIYVSHFRRNRGGKLPFSFRLWGGSGFSPGLQPSRIILTFSHILFWVGFCLLVVAAAGPVRIERRKVFLNRGIDIMIVLDESPSMLAQDFKPTHRFDTAKEVIREFIAGRENDPIGLVSFAQEAVLRVPVTLDYDHLLSRLDSLRVMGLGDGTAIGMGLSLATLHLSASRTSHKVVILLTDGENNAGEISPRSSVELARAMGVKVYSIGVGREGEVLMEIEDPETGRIVRGTYRGKFDEELLKHLAATAGGSYFHATSPGTLRTIFERIDAMERVEKRARIEVQKRPFHTGFIQLGLVLLILALLMRKVMLREIL